MRNKIEFALQLGIICLGLAVFILIIAIQEDVQPFTAQLLLNDDPEEQVAAASSNGVMERHIPIAEEDGALDRILIDHLIAGKIDVDMEHKLFTVHCRSTDPARPIPTEYRKIFRMMKDTHLQEDWVAAAAVWEKDPREEMAHLVILMPVSPDFDRRSSLQGWTVEVEDDPAAVQLSSPVVHSPPRRPPVRVGNEIHTEVDMIEERPAKR